MIDLFALFFAVFLLIQLQRLRGLLSFVFAPLRVRRIGLPRLPDAFADLYAAAEPELRALGFEGPDWYLLDGVGGAVMTQPLAAWRQREQGDVLWLYAPPAPMFANRLLAVFVRRLADGRHCLSETFDCYAEIGADERLLAQTIGGADLAAQWQLHREFCARHGEADPAGSDDAELDWQASTLHEQRLASLQRRGKVYRDSRGLLRPTLAFALEMYRALRRQPKPAADTRPVPPARMVWFAQLAQRQTQLPAPRRVQAGLFGFSVALFLVVGGWFWGPRFAAILFVVVAIHEFGHYLAMRLSGYRNVQMLALPLVGGVTIGHEVKPDAARRAWMSLMGPLPGIVIGWALLFAAFAIGGGSNALIYEAALVFLFINYLNVLPVPPLDGAHVVQELLPVGAARLSAVFIAVASLGGAALAFWFDFKLLAFIALLQLPLVRSRWQLGGVLRALRNDPQLQASRPAAARLRRVFEQFDIVAGTTTAVPARLALAHEAMRSIDVKPMRWPQRVFVGGTYLVLLAGPLVLGAFALVGWQAAQQSAVAAQAGASRAASAQQRLREQADTLDTTALVRGITEQEAEVAELPVPSLPAPADDAACAAAQERLGATLPADLVAFYRSSDGADALGLLPVAQVRRAADLPELDLASYADAGVLSFFTYGLAADGSEAAPTVTLTAAQWPQLLVLGHEPDRVSVVLYDVAEPPLHPGVRVYRLDADGDYAVEPDLTAWLRTRWTGATSTAETTRRIRAGREREATALAGHDVTRLLDSLERPVFWKRGIVPGMAWPGPAETAAIDGIAVRFGATMPADLAAAYGRHDGLPPLYLLPLARWQSAGELDPAMAGTMRAEYARLFADAPADEFDHCVVIAGYSAPAGPDAAERLVYVALLWCPASRVAERRYVDFRERRGWPDFTAVLRDYVALTRASRAAWSDP